MSWSGPGSEPRLLSRLSPAASLLALRSAAVAGAGAGLLGS